MSQAHNTAIEWTHIPGFKGETWNPTTGCSKVSPGCAHCYAEAVTAKWAGNSTGFITEHRPWTPANAAHNVTLWPNRLAQPLRWQNPRAVFVNSMSDLFHEEIPDAFVAEIFAIMALTPRHVYMGLTKRPERMRGLLSSWKFCRQVAAAIERLGREHAVAKWFIALEAVMESFEQLDNVWLGVTIENRRNVHRATVLRETPAAVRFISAEPLLGPLVRDGSRLVRVPGSSRREFGYSQGTHWDDAYSGPQINLTAIDWMIVGGESGPKPRPIQQRWVRDLRDLAESAGVAFFFKQWGGRTPKAGGRELDRRTWSQWPPPPTKTNPGRTAAAA